MNKKISTDLMKFEITDTDILMSIKLKDLKKLFDQSSLIYNEDEKNAKTKKDNLFEFGCKFVEYLMDFTDANAAFNIAQSSQVVLAKDRDLVKSGTGDAQLDMVYNANQPRTYGYLYRRVCQTIDK